MLIHGTIETVHELVEPGLGNYRSRQSNDVVYLNYFNTLYPPLVRGARSLKDQDNLSILLSAFSAASVVHLREGFDQVLTKLLIVSLPYCTFSSSASSLGLMGFY
jgi:hypothetical protein